MKYKCAECGKLKAPSAFVKCKPFMAIRYICKACYKIKTKGGKAMK